ncbi:tumor necrosis factor receptor superfamily member 6-like [Scomber japonicus]|uniref:tumor necrosis factor receptor superfamily member 6-like n=1 Tax=Scomber japonicus TaxID=13676 RepID=UPI002306D417|nr:tumor necrosis factor receptor superfamily member 6-like [Scomber japonicus]
MEASDPIMRCYCFIVVFTLFALSAAQASVAAKFEGKARLSQSKGVIRSKRDVCPNGLPTYDHEGKKCCKCDKGQRWIGHCTATSSTKCEKCASGTYNSLPNDLPTCEPCISCSSNANLEVREHCTSVSDTKCQCKKDHYCTGYMKDTCRLCNPCKVCGDEGIKERCTATNNTVCNGKSEGGNAPTILGVVLPILLIAGIAGIAGTVVFLWKKKCICLVSSMSSLQFPESKCACKINEVVMCCALLHSTLFFLSFTLAPRVDLSPYVHDIAGVIEWKDMEAIATRTGVQKIVIDACKWNHPNDCQAQTLELLKVWVEQQGMQASEKLVQMLQDRGRRHTAEKVHDILCGGSSA